MSGHITLWLLLVPCLFGCEDYEDSSDFYYDVNTDGEQHERSTFSPRQPQESTCWNKLFTILEDSHMRQNMLLQYIENLLNVEMPSLQSELSTLEDIWKGINKQFNLKLDQVMTQLREVANKQQDQHNSTFHQLVEVPNNHINHLSRPETSSLQGEAKAHTVVKTLPAHSKKQDVTNWAEERWEIALKDTATHLQRVHAQLVLFQQVDSHKYLPSGCEMALLFPMRSKHTFAEIIPSISFSLTSLSICLWVKVTQSLSRTVLFSYGTKRNPHELQLWLTQHSVFFAITGKTHLLESKRKVSDGQWGHYCSMWSSAQGLASLWINGEMVANSPGMAKGHSLPEGGSVLLGQEKSHTGMYRDLDPLVAFTGKMTGVNMWEHTLEADMIKEYANQNGACDDRGNVIGWGVSEILPHGGTQYIN